MDSDGQWWPEMNSDEQWWTEMASSVGPLNNWTAHWLFGLRIFIVRKRSQNNDTSQNTLAHNCTCQLVHSCIYQYTSVHTHQHTSPHTTWKPFSPPWLMIRGLLDCFQTLTLNHALELWVSCRDSKSCFGVLKFIAKCCQTYGAEASCRGRWILAWLRTLIRNLTLDLWTSYD